MRSLSHPGSLVALAILALVVGGFATLVLAGGEKPALLAIGPYLVRVLIFSTVQAALSSLLSLVFGAALALALARRRFPGRNLVVSALGLTMVMPTIVAVFAVLAVYGRSGWLAAGLHGIGIPVEISIFGYPGILIAHVFLNAPFVARIMLDALNTVPAEQWRLAQTLGFSPAQILRHLDWPALRGEVPGLAGLVFLVCFKSFAIVLALGGGPARATLEVAIYEALKIDLDFGRAAWLAFIQTALCLALTLALNWAIARPPAAQTVRALAVRPDRTDRGLLAWDSLVLVLGLLFLAPPFLSVLAGLAHVAAVLDADFARAFATSIVIAALAALMACLMALALGGAARRFRLAARMPRLAALYDALPNTLLAVPPFALTAGLFLAIRPFVDPATAGYILLPLINGLGALPFAYRFIGPRIMIAGERYGRLSASLGLRGLDRLKIMDWPILARPLGAAFALAMALSFGDFGVVALFGGTELQTLPYLLYERLGAYRLEEASSIGLLIVLVSFVLALLSGRLSHAAD
ncbi:ABC transporter permease subunit [Microvirga pudoricolor]|uniref:ABC transporter permease subunit n=1 Tax=Microvirga pudoricolor TaxID=2778729 RepID=UPI00194DE886|nr:ABC transporter permease subunit [Microvirga pudoricolor]MBM6593318.1 ABC transporter permease subunit [Microvirga pudoricolor]